MSSLDTWNPDEKELDEVVDRLTPEPEAPGALRRLEDLRNKKRFLDRQKEEAKVAEGLCGYCERPCPREYCGGNCEKQAAFTSMGVSLKFHE